MNDDDEGKKKVLTLPEIAKRLRCSKTHASKLLRGQVVGLPALTHIEMGRRKIVRAEWLDQWMEAQKKQC